MSLLLLTNKHECPQCRAKSNRQYNGHCSNCGMMLFVREISFQSFEDDGNSREWYFFHPANGWMHRSQIMMKQEALSRDIPELVTTRNTKSAEQKAKEAREHARAQMKIAKGNQVGYGHSKTRLVC